MFLHVLCLEVQPVWVKRAVHPGEQRVISTPYLESCQECRFPSTQALSGRLFLGRHTCLPTQEGNPQQTEVCVRQKSFLVSQRIVVGVTNRSVGEGLLQRSKDHPKTTSSVKIPPQ